MNPSDQPAVQGPTPDPAATVAPAVPAVPAAPTTITADDLSAPVTPTAVEAVSRGLVFSLAAIPLGMVAAVAIWRFGFIASISSFLIAGVATWLYTKGAGSAPRRGLVPLVGAILLGVALSFLAMVASDILDFYGTAEGAALGYPSAWSMLWSNLFVPEVLSSYGRDLLMFLAFAALGVFGTLRRLAAGRGR